jgi:TP901 family phage tail tape measure protein
MAENRKIIIEVVARTSGAEKNLNKVGTETEKTGTKAKEANKSFLGLGKTFKAIARGFVIVKSFQLLARTLTEAVKVSAEFEFTMAKVKAIAGATEKEFERLTKSARELALGTMFTATQVGELQLAYSKLGFTTEEILAATEATLNLATATGEDLAGAADVVGATIRGFNLDAEETTRVVDVMAKSFSSSALNLENFKQAMKTIAPIAAAANIDLETSTALLGTLADAGLRGTRAATGLKNIMSKLTDPTSDLAKELGFTIKNADGLFIAFKALAAKNIDLAKATGLTDERSKAAFLTMVNGVPKMQRLRKELEGAAGSADAMAAVLEDTAVGAFKALESSWEETLINMGESTKDFQTNTARILKGILDFINFDLKKAREGLAESFANELSQPVLKALSEQEAALKKSQDTRREVLRRASQQALIIAEREGLDLEELRKNQQAKNLALEEKFASENKELRKQQGKALGDAIVSTQNKINEAIEQTYGDRLEKAQQNVDRLENKLKSSNLANRAVVESALEIAKQNLKSINDEIESVKEKDSVYIMHTKAIDNFRLKAKQLIEIQNSLNKANEDAADSIESLGKKDVGFGSLLKFFEHIEAQLQATTPATMLFDKSISQLFYTLEDGTRVSALDGELGKLNVTFDETLEKLPETQDNTEQVTFTWFEHAEAIAEVIDQYGKHLDAMGMLTSSMNDLFQTLTMNRLNQIVEQNDAELQIFDETQEEIRKKQEIIDNHAVESFIGTQKEKADFERHLALERIEQEKRVDDERKALRQRQLKEENDIARKGFMANKANAIAQVGINLAQEITSIALNASGNPNNIWSFGAAGASQFAILSSIAVANSALQTAAIASQKFQPKTFQDGGTIVGASHSDGGVPFTVAGQAGFEAEGGEYIFSKSTVNRLGTGILDAINFGGASPRMFADGGAIGRATMEASTISQLSMQETLREIVGSITEIPVVNVAQETVDTSRLVENAAAMARL